MTCVASFTRRVHPLWGLAAIAVLCLPLLWIVARRAHYRARAANWSDADLNRLVAGFALVGVMQYAAVAVARHYARTLLGPRTTAWVVGGVAFGVLLSWLVRETLLRWRDEALDERERAFE